jgi:hypothetical protein
MAPNFGLEPFDTAAWHARQRAIYANWRALPRRRGPLPARADFDPFAVPEALGWLWLNDIEREPFRLRCRLFGTLLAKCVGVDITGEYLDTRAIADPKRPVDMERLRATALDGKPSWARTPPIMKHGGVWAEVETLMLPFAADGTVPDMMLGVSTYYRADGEVV